MIIKDWVRRGLRWVAIACCLLLIGCQSPAGPAGDRVRVARVLSGQTLEIINLTEQVATFKVGLLGIEAPVRGQDPWYGQSKAWLESAFAADKSIQLEADLQTQWVNCSRSVSRFAYVWQGNVLLNEKLIETGHALVGQSVSTLKYRQRLIRAQEKARLAGVGIWNPQQPLRERPSEFCQQNSSKT